MEHYKKLALGGTFDHLHAGHKAFIRHAASLGEEVVVGLTSDIYTKTVKDVWGLENFDERKKELEKFLQSENLLNVSILSIDTPYGPLVSSREFDALVVSAETQQAGNKINEERTAQNLSPLSLIVFPHILGEDGEVISSSRIRAGIINREGKPYINPEWQRNTLVLPVDLRKELQKPIGKVINPSDFLVNYRNKLSHCIAVGDVTTKFCNAMSIPLKMAIVDFVVKRKKTFHSTQQLGFKGSENTQKVTNPAGSIVSQWWTLLRKDWLKDNNITVVIVDGEEDLLVLPVVLCAPLGYSLLYGQPDKGLVWVEINENTKNLAYSLASKFDF